MRLRNAALIVAGIAVLAPASAMAQVHIEAPRIVVRPPRIVQPAPVYVNPGYAVPVQPAVVAGPAWQNPQVFAARVRARMDEAGAEVHHNVQAGALPPRAIRWHQRQRGQIEQQLSWASQDGLITPEERQNINGQVDNMRNAPPQPGRGYGGGPGVGAQWNWRIGR